MAVGRGGLPRRYVLLLLVLTAVTLITLDQRRDDSGPLGAVGRVAHDVVEPIRRATDVVVAPVADWIDGVSEAGSLKDDNEELRRELAEAQAQLDRAQDAIQENERLHAILDLPYPLNAETIAARVVSPAPGNFEQTVVLDKGSDHGIRVDMPVVASDGLYGRVVEASARQAKVLLVTDETFSASVRLANGRVTGIVSGRGGGRDLELEFLAGVEEDAIARGDPVVTAGQDDSLFPSGIPVGEVSDLEEEAGGLFVTAAVEPVVDLDVVEVVLVVVPETVRVPDLSETGTPEVPSDEPTDEPEPVDDGADVSVLTTTTTLPEEELDVTVGEEAGRG